ncbi:ring finger protein-like [Eublepharis macularius]|uniref:Ring finger protein-like n=1 Tax=Eublepharis macularius TaxID=481883 RepID=A0AA97LJD9_EUBMA|nr:ring finger protein-like [Eublepharis macularius]
MAGTSLESGGGLMLEQALLCDPEKEEVHLTMSPPGTLGQTIVLDMEQSCGTPRDAKAEEDGVAAKGPAVRTKASGTIQCKGSDWSEDLGSSEEDLSHSQTAWAEEGDPEQSPASPNKPLAACRPGGGQLPCTVLEEEEVSLAPLAVEEECYSVRVEQELPMEENMAEVEHSCLLETRGWALSRGEPGIVTQSCCIQTEDDSMDEQECPICTELYDQDKRRPALLNCSHVLCDQCLRSIMEASSAADIGRVRCPICRQKTPMMEWEICKLQEEMLLMNSEQGPAVAPPTFTALPARRPGVWGSLEHHFQVRFHTTRMVGFLPCLRYPPSLISGLARLEQHCRWCYRLALVGLLISEMLSLLLVFLPIVLLLLLFLILDK